MSLAPRKSALAILMNIEQGGRTLDQQMDRFHAESCFDRRDEAFVNALVYGVLRWRGRLDWIIQAVASKVPAKMDPGVLSILRMGLYQIIFMDRVPNSAAVNTSVDLSKSLNKKWLTGFVNAVLRNALRRLPAIPFPNVEDDPVGALAADQSMPPWLAKRWIHQFGQKEAAALCAACNQIPPLVLRTHTLRIDPDSLLEALQPFAEQVRPSPYTPEGILLDGLKGPLFASDAYANGWFQVQDEAAQAVSHLLAPQPGHMVLDACAGLGGKTAHIAALMKNTGRITATDRDAGKLRKLSQEMLRLGIDIVSTRASELLKGEGLDPGESYDRVLLDAPCSGLGVIRRNPDAKWSRTPQDIDRCARRQNRLLANLAPRVKPGGLLVYAVCSTEPEETQAVIDSFLNKQTDFAIDRNLVDLPLTLRPLLDRQGRLLTIPHKHATDGFFAVRLRRFK